ncbi:arylesterase [Motiliproteus sp. SC1-56]|uniref:arylesterase n=1 Tax=Motiliproteus sp. SC1-56 TaxID=2799565 RepID=UPI001A9099E6|nr:arylesterase [Motiliproteus sp. SC1-56]
MRLACFLFLFLLLPLRATANELLVLGDSISAAYGMEREAGWVSLLQARLDAEGVPVEVINASISGETTSGGLTRLPGLLERHQPEWLILELGGNDGLRGTPLNLIESNLEALVEHARAAGAGVVLLGMRIPPNYGPRYAEGFYDLYGRIAKRHGLPLQPFFLEGVATRPPLMQDDGIHPTAEAQPLLLDNVWPLLEPLLTPPAG